VVATHISVIQVVDRSIVCFHTFLGGAICSWSIGVLCVLF